MSRSHARGKRQSIERPCYDLKNTLLAAMTKLGMCPPPEK